MAITWKDIKKTDPELYKFSQTIHAYNERIRNAQKLGEMGNEVAKTYIEEFINRFDYPVNFSGGSYQVKGKSVTIEDYITKSNRITMSVEHLKTLYTAINPDYKSNKFQTDNRRLKSARTKYNKAIKTMTELNTANILARMLNNVYSYQNIYSSEENLTNKIAKQLKSKKGKGELMKELATITPVYNKYKDMKEFVSKMFSIVGEHDSDKWYTLVKRYDYATLEHIINRYAKTVKGREFNPETDSIDMLNFYFPDGQMSLELLECTDERFKELSKVRLKELKNKGKRKTVDKIY